MEKTMEIKITKEVQEAFNILGEDIEEEIQKMFSHRVGEAIRREKKKLTDNLTLEDIKNIKENG